MDLDIPIQKNSCVFVGLLPFKELQDVLDLVLYLVPVLELIDINEQKVDSVVTIGEDNQNDKWASNKPGDNTTLKESVFHDLCKP
jgi:hypothetical protein